MSRATRAPLKQSKQKGFQSLSSDAGSPPDADAPTSGAAADGGGGSGPSAPVENTTPRLLACEMPTLGRIVVVVGRPIGTPAPEGAHGQHMAALVTRVHQPHVVDLTVFPPGGPLRASHALEKVPHGTAPGEWLWPRELPED